MRWPAAVAASFWHCARCMKCVRGSFVFVIYKDMCIHFYTTHIYINLRVGESQERGKEYGEGSFPGKRRGVVVITEVKFVLIALVLFCLIKVN